MESFADFSEQDEEAFRSPEHRAGFVYRCEGLPKHHNPFIANTREAIDWDDGWRWAESISEAWLDLHAVYDQH